MIKEFILPDIGEGVVECELVEWLVSEGDVVTEDQPIADVMTDKALVQIPAPHGGVIKKLYYAKGEIAKVHAPLYSVDISDTEQDALNDDTGTVKNKQNSQSIDENISLPESVQCSEQTQIEAFLLPDIGEGIVECELVEWLVNEGDVVVEDQPIADVMTDKALVQIPAMKAGKIVKLHYRKGQLAKVHQPLFSIEVESEKTIEATSLAPIGSQSHQSQVGVISESVSQGKALASPAVRRMARSLEIDISTVRGSGKSGRVYKEDIERHQSSTGVTSNKLKSKSSAHETSATMASPAPASSQNINRVEPIRGVQAMMAKLMTESVSTIPHFTYCEEIDLTELVKLRESMKKKYSNDELKLTMMPFFMKSLSLAIKQFPVINSKVNADCTELTYFNRHNIGMAVDSKVGLLVPNVKDVQDKSILEIATEITRLTVAARSGRVSPGDLKEGTVSISNIGALGGTVATPIINKPEVAIVALGKMQVLPRFNSAGEVEARKIMQISWSGDHRVIDGGTIAKFCNLWKLYLEHPQEMLLAMQ
ncbi:MAG: dihydrolipoyllysine-residue acetyltransferase [Shewanella sp.]